MIPLALVVAAADNDVIGRDNQLPWHLPEDLKHFKRVTLGKPIIMGRKTFDSIGRPLPGRTNIVITRQSDWRAEGTTVVHDLPAAIALAEKMLTDADAQEVLVIGGAEIYRQALPLAQRIYLTRVHLTPAGDAFFPALAPDQWREAAREDHQRDGETPLSYSFVTLERVAQ